MEAYTDGNEIMTNKDSKENQGCCTSGMKAVMGEVVFVTVPIVGRGMKTGLPE